MKVTQKQYIKNTRGVNNKGFTLVELIITMAVLGILLSGSVWGLMQWQRHSIYNKNNEYAQTLFLAAQSALAHREAGNNLDDLSQYVNNGGDYCGLAKDYTPERTLYYMDIHMDEGEHLQSNPLYLLLKDYVYDKQIFDAAIRLEFDPDDGTVYAVSYTDRALRFDYSQADGSDGQTMGISQEIRNNEPRRKKQLLGYYDTEIAKIISQSYYRPNFKEVSLINEETLHLHMALSSKYQSYMSRYTYRLDVFADDKKSLSFTIDGAKLLGTDNADGKVSHPVNVDVTFYDDAGNSSEPETYPIEVCVNAKGEIDVILDAADLNAAGILDTAINVDSTLQDPLYSKNYLNTTSIVRFMTGTGQTSSFGIPTDAQTIYVTATASFDKFSGKSTSSNEENPLMASIKTSSGAKDSCSYTVNNGRHLFNIRYLEVWYDKKPEKMREIIYIQKKDFAWNGADGIVACYSLYDSSQTGTSLLLPESLYPNATAFDVDATNQNCAPFPAIPFLGENSLYTAEGKLLQSDYAIRMLTLFEDRTADLKSDLLDKSIVQYALGIFRVNKGNIRNMRILDASVVGRNYVGAICGLNKGMLNYITIEHENYEEGAAYKRNCIIGLNYVGGIAGSDMLPLSKAFDPDVLATGSYKNLINEADITGYSYVGGILGASCLNSISQTEGFEIINCINKGSVSVSSSVSPKDTCEYFGGIVGYLHGGTIQECHSSLGNSSFMDLESPDMQDEQEIFGDFMGGIAGRCANDTSILSCSTDGGLLFGHNYVGGIVGLWENSENNPLDGNGASNAATIIGFQYVGGIAGANTLLDTDNVPIKNQSDYKGELKNWKNTGVVIPISGYGGGITGYNTGLLNNCNSTMDTYSVNGEEVLSKISTWKASPLSCAGCVGGLVGYNNGSIVSDKKLNVVSIVTGSDYTGGLIGYNDTNAEVDLDKYVLKGGYIVGDSYVGGLIGCNTSPNVFKIAQDDLKNYSLQASPNRVYGLSFVGGCIGGNFVAAEQDLYIQCNVTNGFGLISAETTKGTSGAGVCVGGFLGYNRLFPAETDKDSIESALEHLADVAARASWGNFHPGESDGNGTIVNPPLAEQLITELLSDETASGKTLYILDTSSNNKYGNTSGMVTGGILIGGIVGYNADTSFLNIKGVKNEATVQSVFYVGSKDKTCLTQNNAGDYLPADMDFDSLTNTYKSINGDTIKYSYTGGIIGYAANGVTIDSCISTGELFTAKETTFKGILTEVNDGKIIDCVSQSFGDASSEYIGGIVGRNEKDGKIYNCSSSGTLTGKIAVGGIAAENYGEIAYSDKKSEGSFTELKGRLNVSTACAGGVAAFNAGIIKDMRLTASIDGKASYVGGFVGINYGALSDIDINASNNLYVKGSTYVGGCIGYICNISDKTLVIGGTEKNPLISNINVTAEGLKINGNSVGNAGGIIGYMQSGEITTQYCNVKGNIVASSGNAGGISANNTGRIVSCTVKGDVTASNGMCGGITARNYSAAEIISCYVGNESKNLTLMGQTYTGGISAQNAGNIFSCQVGVSGNVLLKNISSLSGSSIGGITGLNEGNGTIGTEKGYACWVGINNRKIQISSSSSNSKLGGIAGENQGKIYGGNTETKRYILSDISLENNSVTGWLGGVAGYNSGIISNIYCISDINGQNGANGGFGGIAGENTSYITNCDFSGTVKAIGSTADIVSVGGIAGKNTTDGRISYCTLAQSCNTVISTQTPNKESCSYIGGAAGRNDGEIFQIICADNDEYSVTIEASKGNVGGMIGYQTASGKLHDCENNKKWKITADEYYSDSAIGGMIGYSTSDESMYNLINWASVSRNDDKNKESNSAGGIIGRLENTTSNAKKISNCINWGEVKDNARVGGIIGQWKYKGGVIENCTNNGNIIQTGTNSNISIGSGGIIGVLYQIDNGDTVQISQCINHGGISGGKNCAGILGNSRQFTGTSTLIQIAQCVNTGTIGSGGAGIYAAQDVNCRTELIGCRNYGYANGSDKQKISGILGTTKSDNLLMKDCYGVAAVNPQITNVINKNEGNKNYNNYYFETGISESEDDSVYMSYKLENYKPSNDNPIKNAFDYDPTTRFIGEATQSNPIQNAEDRLALSMEFFNASGFPTALATNSMQITWFNNSTDRKYYYKLYVKYEDSDSFECLEPPEKKYWTQSAVNPELQEKFWIGSSVKNLITLPTDSEDLSQVEVKFSDSSSWRSDSKIKAVKIEYYSNSDAGEGKSRFISIHDIHIDGISIKSKPITNSANGWDAALYIKRNGNIYSADFSKEIPLPYIKELSANPLNEATWNYSSKVLYNLIDKQLKQGTAERVSLSKPENVILKLDSNTYKLSWDEVKGALSYYVTIKLYDSPNSTTPIENKEYSALVPTGTEINIPVKSSWGNLYMRGFVKAVHVLTDADNNYDSEENISKPLQIKPPLPTPAAHLERLYENGKSYIALCIDNIDNFYDSDRKLYPCSFSVIINNDVKAKIKLSDTNFNLETGEGKVETLLEKFSSNSNISLQFQTVSDDSKNYLNSATVSVQTAIPAASKLETNALSQITVRDSDGARLPYYTGESPENIGFTAWLKTDSEAAYYYKSDLLMFDKDIGMDVSVSSTETFLSKYAGDVRATVNNISSEIINNLVDTLIDNGSPILTARTYLWATQGHSLYFGRRLPVNGNIPLTATELMDKYSDLFIEDGNYYINDENGSQILKKRFKIKDGYTVEKISGETDVNETLYNIYYSTILGATDLSTKKLKYGEQASIVPVTVTARQNPAPIMSTEYSSENGKFCFTWDTRKSKDEIIDNPTKNALYNVTVTGITSEGNRIELLSTHGQTNNFIEVEQDGLNYVNMEVQVIRQSSILSSQKGTEIIDKFFSCSRHIYRTYLPLPQITMPSLKLHDNNQDELKYDIVWKSIDETAARNDLKEYQIFALVPFKTDDGTEITKEYLEFSFGQSHVDTYIDSDGETSGWKVLLGTKSKTPSADYEDKYDENILESCNLESLQGHRVRFFVNAIAVPHEDENGNVLENVIYTDSDEGVMSNEILLPKRLVLPSDIKFQLSYGDGKGDEVRTDNEFSKLSLNFMATSVLAAGDGAYKFEAAIYPEKHDDITIVEKKNDGSYIVSEDACENGSIKVNPLVPEKGILIKTPGGSLNNTSLSLKAEELTGWSNELAGKYLIIRCRVADDSNISSHWSDYQVYQLPSSFLSAPIIKEHTNSFTVGEHEGKEYALSWISSEHANGYEIELHTLGGDNISTRKVALSITFNESGKPNVISEGKTINPQINNSSFEFKLTDLFSYTAEWPWSSDSQQRVGVLNITRKEGINQSYYYEFTLSLPDVNSIEYNGMEYQYLYTSMIQVTAKADPDSSYQDSDSGVWIRIAEENDVKKLSTCVFEWNRQDNIDEVIQDIEGSLHYQKYNTSIQNLPEIIKISQKNMNKNSLEKNSQVSGNSICDNSIPEKESDNDMNFSDATHEPPPETVPEESTENSETSEDNIESVETSEGNMESIETSAESHGSTDTFSELEGSSIKIDIPEDS